MLNSVCLTPFPLVKETLWGQGVRLKVLMTDQQGPMKERGGGLLHLQSKQDEPDQAARPAEVQVLAMLLSCCGSSEQVSVVPL